MSLTPSNMLPLGTEAPDFTLPDTISDKELSLTDISSDKATLIMFICNHCPYVKHINRAVVDMAKDYQSKGISFIAISSNDVENYPQDSPALMKENAAQEGYTFPYLYDESQAVAKAYDAACTPDFYLFDGEMKLAYRGRMDGSTPGNNIENNGEDLRKAMDFLLEAKPMFENQVPSMGCNIKWK